MLATCCADRSAFPVAVFPMSLFTPNNTPADVFCVDRHVHRQGPLSPTNRPVGTAHKSQRLITESVTVVQHRSRAVESKAVELEVLHPPAQIRQQKSQHLPPAVCDSNSHSQSTHESQTICQRCSNNLTIECRSALKIRGKHLVGVIINDMA